MPVKRAMYLEPVWTNLPGLQTVQGSSYTKVEKRMKCENVVGEILHRPKAALTDTPAEQSQSCKIVGLCVLIILLVMFVVGSVV